MIYSSEKIEQYATTEKFVHKKNILPDSLFHIPYNILFPPLTLERSVDRDQRIL